MSAVRVILRDIPPEDYLLATRAVTWLIGQPDDKKDGIIVYGEEPRTKAFYVKRNKSSITVRGQVT